MSCEINNLGKNNIIDIPDNIIQNGNMVITITGSNNKLKIGQATTLGSGVIEIRNNQCEIDIGKSCFINGQIMCLWDETRIIIGEKTSMLMAQITLHEKGTITLGKDCLLSGNIIMDVSDMHSILDAKTMKRINPPQDISIQNHVWIGFGVYIMKGSTIGSDSIIGANAVVTSSIPNNCLAVGVPAKAVKTGVTWDQDCLPY